MKKRILSFFSVLLSLCLTLSVYCAGEGEGTYTPPKELVPDYTLVLCNGTNDKDYVERSDSISSNMWRLMNTDKQTVYKFDLSQYNNLVVYVKVSNNYLLEASGDDSTYEKVIAYSDISSERITASGMSNVAVHAIEASKYSDGQYLYIRIANDNPAERLGGAVIEMYLKSDVESDRYVVNYGHVTGNDTVTAADALSALQSAVGKASLSDELRWCADVDCDGTVTASDALCILQYSVGKISLFPAEQKREDNMALKDKNTIMFIGDSITDCERNRSDDTNFGYPYSYSTRIREMLPALYGDREFTLYNRGYSGSTSSQLIELFKNDLKTVVPDVVTILVGINDVVVNKTQGGHFTVDQYKENLTTLISMARGAGATVVVASPFLFPCRTGYSDGWRPDVLERVAAAKEVCEGLDVPYTDMDSVYTDEWDCQNTDVYLSFASGDDGVHLVDYGHRVLATEMINMLASLGI